MADLLSKSLIPGFLSPELFPLRYALVQIILSIPVVIAGYRFYTVGFRNLFQGSPNMDSLIGLGTGTAYAYGIYAVYMIATGSTEFVGGLYFETAGVIIALILLGKYLEAITGGKTSEAIRKLMGLAPKTATIIKDGKEVTGGVVIMRYGENPLKVIEGIKKKIKEIEPGLPKGIKIVPFYDRTELINRATGTLRTAVLWAVITAAAVILALLGHILSSLIISLILPIGILICFLVMYIMKVP